MLGQDGYARFESLGISNEINNFQIEYEFKLPKGVLNSSFNPYTLRQSVKNSTKAILTCQANKEKLIINENQKFNLSISLVDQISLFPIKNISWKNHEWQASISLFQYSKCNLNGTLRIENNSTLIDPIKGLIWLNNLSIDKSGMYLLILNIKSSNQDYNLNCTTNSILVKSSAKTLVLDEQAIPNFYLKFEANFTQHENNIEEYKALVYNCLILKHDLTLNREITVYEGSIMVNTALEGATSNINYLKEELIEGFDLVQNVSLKSVNFFDRAFDVKVDSTNSTTITVTQNQVTLFPSLKSSSVRFKV